MIRQLKKPLVSSVFLLSVGRVFAFEISLSDREITSASHYPLSFTVTNSTSEPAAYSAQVMVRRYVEDKEVHDQAFPDFVIAPAQFVVLPNQPQKIDVLWPNAQMPDKEIPLRLIVTRQVVEGDQPKSEDVIEVVRSVYIMPEGVRPDIHIAGWAPSTEPTHRCFLLENKGTSRLRPKQINLQADGKDWMFVADKEEPADGHFVPKMLLAGDVRPICFEPDDEAFLNTSSPVKLLKAIK